MSQDDAATAAAAPAEGTEPDAKQKKQDESAESQEQQRQEAWAARRHLIAHGPSFVMPLARTRIERDLLGVSGGTVKGDVNYNFGPQAPHPEHLSGEIRREQIEELSSVFHECPSFNEALARLRPDRVVVLAGGRDTGRRSAALMLLWRLQAGRVLNLDPPGSISSLLEQLDDAAGYVLLNLATSRSHPLREPHLLGLCERLERAGGYLVITVEPSAALEDVPFVRWEPPTAEDMLRSHVIRYTEQAVWEGLRGLAPVTQFLERQQQPREVEQFAHQLVAFHNGEMDEGKLAAYSKEAVTAQVSRWLTDEQRPTSLHEKAFLIALAVFDKAPYAVTAELADLLYARLQHTANPRVPPEIPVFGASREERLRVAHARGYWDTEVTEWGPLVGQYFAAFQDERIAPLLLAEVWNLHPSARPALVEWIQELADDGRPLVRTRAASVTALLATADLSSAMALLIEPWADDDQFGSWLTAANALTMAQLLDVRAVFRILHDWCTADYDGAEGRRWTAIRTYGLLGPVHHEHALSALLEAIRGQHRPYDLEDDEDDEAYAEYLKEEAIQFADALELLLLALREPVLRALAEHLTDHDRTVRNYALLAFLQACGQPDEANGRPLVLNWYARAAAAVDDTDARHLIAFWQAALADRACTAKALRILRGWVVIADQDAEAEAALTSLLPALVTTPANHSRVSHLLRTVRDADRGRFPAADRLLARISTS
ncbi:hypothetical protein [Streptomyces sp. HGB0020]|uniref:hypothetical protein n=1 Tax=Streptomyces sp. HGB0020 TaxID=1078086 RepID=UPI00034E3790|nr:hypothetical protein [Streptomyces sp. HGB0020]EPD55449.1 hypothetical protein HMPREF1211_07876 [Streptomyces sp. HGB0020]EPD61035.1 hypothetical protein HMPREF1211_04681 [Streptomyces sp. HGB0020]